MTKMDKKLEPETTQTPERPRRFCDEWGVLRVPVTGTPWAVVWTNDSRAFFHNAVTKESVWEVPAALADNPEVAKMIESSKMRKSPVRDPGLYLQLAAMPEVVEAEYRIVFVGSFLIAKELPFNQFWYFLMLLSRLTLSIHLGLTPFMKCRIKMC